MPETGVENGFSKELLYYSKDRQTINRFTSVAPPKKSIISRHTWTILMIICHHHILEGANPNSFPGHKTFLLNFHKEKYMRHFQSDSAKSAQFFLVKKKKLFCLFEGQHRKNQRPKQKRVSLEENSFMAFFIFGTHWNSKLRSHCYICLLAN